jgi:hypothetical protein
VSRDAVAWQDGLLRSCSCKGTAYKASLHPLYIFLGISALNKGADKTIHAMINCTEIKNSKDDKKDLDIDRIFFKLGVGGSSGRLDELEQPVTTDGAENRMKLNNKTINIGRRRTCYFSLEETKREASHQHTEYPKEV